MAPVRVSRSRVTGWPVGRVLSRRAQVACWVLLGLTLIVVGVIVLTPGPPAPGAQHSLGVAVERGHADGSVPAAVTTGRIEWTANVVMFLPIGFFLAGAIRPSRRLVAVPFAVLLSAGIELAQYLWLPNRVATGYDVLANGTGAVVGAVLLIAATRIRRRTD